VEPGKETDGCSMHTMATTRSRRHKAQAHPHACTVGGPAARCCRGLWIQRERQVGKVHATTHPPTHPPTHQQGRVIAIQDPEQGTHQAPGCLYF
jgi:hypothetical protein